MRVLGVDGCRQGWVGIILREGAFERAILKTTRSAFVEAVPDARAIGVDIPLGTEPHSFRGVDSLAKRFVGPRASSVFLVPPIEVLRLNDYPSARDRCRALTAAAPSRQLFALGPKIIEAAELAVGDNRIIEVHPEVSFRAILERPLGHTKKTWAGQNLRRAALLSVGLALPDDLGPAGSAAPDDVLDAAVVAWSAHRHAQGRSCRLGDEIHDVNGRPIAIWY